jgi:hypothetical protein
MQTQTSTPDWQQPLKLKNARRDHRSLSDRNLRSRSLG